jgi:hypothetical protein
LPRIALRKAELADPLVQIRGERQFRGSPAEALYQSAVGVKAVEARSAERCNAHQQ